MSPYRFAALSVFARKMGFLSNPLCGSDNSCVAALIRQHRVLTVSRYVASQGRCLRRDGHIAVEYGTDGTIWLGGHAVTCVDGSISV